MTEEPRQRDLIDHVLRSCPFLERIARHPEYTLEDSRLCSKFGGINPFRRDNFKWPVCSECGELKYFGRQINIANLPPLLQQHIKMTSGLFQFFYCHECMPDETFEDMYIVESPDLVPSLKSLAAEKVGALKGYNPMFLPPILRTFVNQNTESMGIGWDNEANVDGWIQKTELPKYLEILDSDTDIAKKIKREANLTDEQYQSFVGQLSDGHYEDVCFTSSGAISVESVTKLGGWIHWWWDKPVMYLECPDCEVDMNISFLQISEDEEFWGHPQYFRNAFVMFCPKCKKPGMLRM